MATLIKEISLRLNVVKKGVVDRLFELLDCRLAEVDARESFLDRKRLVLMPYAFVDLHAILIIYK